MSENKGVVKMVPVEVKEFDLKEGWLKCPHCGAKVESVNYWGTTSVAFEFSLKTKDCGDIIDRSDTLDFEGWACPECGADLVLPKEIEAALLNKKEGK